MNKVKILLFAIISLVVGSAIVALILVVQFSGEESVNVISENIDNEKAILSYGENSYDNTEDIEQELYENETNNAIDGESDVIGSSDNDIDLEEDVIDDNSIDGDNNVVSSGDNNNTDNIQIATIHYIIDTYEYKVGGKVGALIKKPKEPIQYGYDFVNWYSEADFSGEAWNFSRDIITEEYITLYGKFEPKEVTVKLNPNNGEEAELQELNYGDLIEVPKEPAYYGYDFVEWNTEADGSGEVWDFTKKINTEEDINLYAKWVPRKVTVTINPNNGEEAELQELNYGDLIEVPKEPAYYGYDFVEWNTEADGSGEVWDFDINKVNDENNIQLFAIWNPKFIKTMYTLDDFGHLKDAGLHRGARHDAQHLGVYLEPSTEFRIRQTNPTSNIDTKVRLYSDNKNTSVSTIVPASGEWTTITTPNAYTVPFVKTPIGNGATLGFEFEYNENTKDIPVFNYGDEEEIFFEEWINSNAPYAIYDSDYITILVPEISRDTSDDINYILKMYEDMLTMYNDFAGLDNDADEVWNQNVQAKYLVTADINGAGSAYYTIDHVSQSENNIDRYLIPHWMSNHEVGHGYQGGFFEYISLSEVWNNIYANYFQHGYGHLYTSGDWLNQDANEEWFETERQSNGYTYTSLKPKLYFWVNMLDKIGAEEAMSNFNRGYRKIVYNDLVHPKDQNLFIQLFSEGTGYNVAPYFESWWIDSSDETKELAFRNNYKNVYTLRHLTQNDEQAEMIKTQLGMHSIYDLVENSEISDFGYTGTVNIDFSGVDTTVMDRLAGKKVEFYDGNELLYTVDVDTVATITVPIGVYSVKMPEVDEMDTVNTYIKYVPVVANENITVVPTYEDMQYSELASDYEYVFLGLGDVKYATVEYDLNKGELYVNTINTQPHSYINYVFSYIYVADELGNEVFYQEHIGTEEMQSQTITIPIKEGYRVDMYHKEARSRLKIEGTYAPDTSDITGSYFEFYITENGPEYQTDIVAQTAKDAHIEKLNYYTDTIVYNNSEEDILNKDLFIPQKKIIKSALTNMSVEDVNNYYNDYPIMQQVFN